MRITCEHCGTGINTDKDKRCPNCGASYANNKEYREERDTKRKHTDYDFREREAEIRAKELGNQMIEKTLDAQSRFKLFPIIVFLLALAIIGFVVYKMFNFSAENKTFQHPEEETITVQFNENAISNEYDIKCDGITKYKRDEFEKESNDVDIYNFHIVLNNKSDSFILTDKIGLTYTDDKGNENISAKKHMQNMEEYKNALTSIAMNKVVYTGNLSFEIPTYVKDVKIIYENSTIIINDFKDKIN